MTTMTVPPDWVPMVDWSDYQAAPDYRAALGAGVVGGWRKAGQGLRFTEHRYGSDATRAAGDGFRFGAYWYPELVLSADPAAEAARFDQLTNGWAGCTLAPMVDVEDVPGQSTMVARFGPAGTAELVCELAAEVHRRSGRTPILYVSGLSGPGAQWSPCPELGTYACWVPHYGSTQDYATLHGPSFVPGWGFTSPPGCQLATLVQHSGGNGRCPGFAALSNAAVDLDLIHPALLGDDPVTDADIARIVDALRPVIAGEAVKAGVAAAQVATRYVGELAAGVGVPLTEFTVNYDQVPHPATPAPTVLAALDELLSRPTPPPGS